MKGLFVILLDGDLITYTNYDDIPDSFDNLVRYEPEYPEGPHTEEEHEEMDRMTDRLYDLLSRETR